MSRTHVVPSSLIPAMLPDLYSHKPAVFRDRVSPASQAAAVECSVEEQLLSARVLFCVVVPAALLFAVATGWFFGLI